jgi:hypothetical protein
LPEHEHTTTVDRGALQAAVDALAGVVPARLDTVPAHPQAQAALSTAASCLQAAAGFLTSVTTDPGHGALPIVGWQLGGEYLHRARHPRPDHLPGRDVLELGTEVVTEQVRYRLRDTHCADPDNQTRLALAQQCLQIAAHYLTALTTTTADLPRATATAQRDLDHAYTQYNHTLQPTN